MIIKLLWLLWVASWFNYAQAKPELRWCMSTFPGFYGFNAITKQPEGPSVDYLQEIARRADFTLVPSTDTPFPRCFAQMASGETDLMINILKTGEGRPGIEYIQFATRWPDRVYSASNQSLRLEVPGQLATMTLATIRNYKVAPEIQIVLDSMKKKQLVQVDSTEIALQMVAKQRIDAAILPMTQVQSVLEKYPELVVAVKETTFAPDLVKPQEIYIGLSKQCNCPQLQAAIRQSIQSMRDDGTSQKIFGNKIMVDF